MSEHKVVLCSTFHLVNGEKSVPAIESLIEKHVDDHRLELVILDGGTTPSFSLEMEGEEVGDSFGERLSSLAKEMTPYLADSFCMTLRADSMSDERDNNIFGGPSPESVDEFRQNHYINEALSLVGGAGAKLDLARQLLKGILKGESPSELVNHKDIRVSEAAKSLDEDQIAAWIKQRIDDGELDDEQLPLVMARYALGDPNALREEIAERIAMGPENSDEDSPTAERNQ